MTTEATQPRTLRVVIAGGGVAALEALLALRHLAGERVAMTVLAPDPDFVYRPMAVREPFAYARAARYALAPIVADVGAELVSDKLDRVDRDKQIAYTSGGQELEYDALVLALGAQLRPRYEHALTIDDRRMDETIHGLIQDIEGGYLDSVAFVAPGRMAWPLPLYELALMTAGRAYEMDVALETTIVTPEDRPLAIFGEEVSDGVAALLEKTGIRTITSAYAEVPASGELVVNPGDRRLSVKRVIALPELYGPSIRGLAVSDHGFIGVDRFGQVPHSGPIFAAGDATDFAVKQGGVGSQQADVVAESIAALAGAPVEPQSFKPVLHGILLTNEGPRYISAHITGGQGFSSHFSETPPEGPVHKIEAKHLSPYLDKLDRKQVAA